MKRGLKVKTVVAAPSRPVGQLQASSDPDYVEFYTFAPAPLCTTSPPCGHCWYCLQARNAK